MSKFPSFVFITLLALTFQAYHYAGRDYRQDEAWIIHGNLHHSPQEIVVWVSGNIHVPLWMVMADVWVEMVGHLEQPARHLSVLFTSVSLALVYRLGADLYGRRAGLAAVLLLGCSSFFLFYSYEFRPYPALLMFTLAVQVTFLRWLRRPDFKHALAFVLCGIAALYSHFFALYLLAGITLFALVFLPPQRFFRAFALLAAIGLSFLGWILPFLHAILIINPYGVNYAYESNWESITRLYLLMAFRPEGIAAFLLIIGMLRPASNFALKWYPVVIAVSIFVLAFVINVEMGTLTQRNVVILLPPIAVFLGFGLTQLPKSAQIAAGLLMLVSAFAYVDYEAPGPYADMVLSMEYQPDAPVVVNIEFLPWQIPTLYYLQERLTHRIDSEHILQVINPRQNYTNFMPVKPVNAIYTPKNPSMEQIEAFIGDAPVVWYITRVDDTNFRSVFEPFMHQRYTIHQQTEWGENYQHFLITEYRRIANESTHQPEYGSG